MNQPPDPYQQNPQYPPPTVYAPNNVPPTVSVSQQPPYGEGTPYTQSGVPPYPPDYNQQGNYPPPNYLPQQPSSTTYPPQPFPAGYPPQQPGQWPGYPPQVGPQRRGKTGWIIGGISAAVIIIIIAVAVMTHGFRPEPPSGWLYQSSSSKSIDFVHWTNQDGHLNGSWDETTSNGQSISFAVDGNYNYQDHTITLNLHYLGLSISINGNIQGNTMILHSPSAFGTSSTNSDLTFHSASQQDYDNAKRNSNSPSY